MVERFVEKSAANGIDVFRIFDALNDLRNLKTSIAAVKKTGKHAQGAICYTVSPLHTVEAFAEMAYQLREMGCDSICIKDMAALLRPQPAYRPGEGHQEAVRHGYAGACSYPRDDRSHDGLADEGDRGRVRHCGYGGQFPFTGAGTQSDGEPDRAAGRDRVRDPRGSGAGAENLEPLCDRSARATRSFSARTTGVDTEIFKSQIPGGMISNMESQLKGQGAGDRLQEVLAEVPRVRKDSGYPPLVTPTSQIVGSQAVFNVLMGKYKVLTGEFADLMLGYYGATIGPKDPEVLKQAEAHAKKPAITVRPADLQKPEWESSERGGEGAEGFEWQRRRRADLCDVPAGRAEVFREPRPRTEESGQGPGKG